ncbi:MAG TPA: uracil-DNA glycosylase family protein [Methylomirabilota bacterium]|nr:uracil-DNA glycosylase family protein [Methylomirabilota bacterium]
MSPLKTSRQLIAAARELAAQVDRLKFQPPVTHIYNPLDYAWAAHEKYLRKFGDGKKRVVFLGMNPGPFGMVQTGIPFGEIAAAKKLLGLDDKQEIKEPKIGRPKSEHPKRPVLGFDCPNSEVSGRRLWGLFLGCFDSPEKFFTEHFVVNYCPLAFMMNSGKNLTPDKLRKGECEKLLGFCDAHLRRVLEILEPEWLVGVGNFAEERGKLFSDDFKVKVGRILHPAPANPKANQGDWGKKAAQQLVELGVWK